MMNEQYSELITSLKEHVRLSQQQAVLTVNTRLLFLYWEIGHFINRQKKELGWGASVIKEISSDLSSEFPDIRGFSVRNLNYMAQFAETSHFSIVQPPSAQTENQPFNYNKNVSFEKMQPPVAQIESPLHWTEFLSTPIAKVSWSGVATYQLLPKEETLVELLSKSDSRTT